MLFTITGNNCRIEIGDFSSFDEYVQLEVNEDNQFITIGKDCMFSNHIIVRTNDSHPIFDKETKVRINPPKSILLRNHIWVAGFAKILKGVTIESGSIIGMSAIVTHDVPENVIVTGAPAKIIKHNIIWKRDY